MASSPEIPATSEVLLKSDASKQFLDSLLGQGWDAWGQGLGGSQAAELMLEMFSAFNIVALATISAVISRGAWRPGICAVVMMMSTSAACCAYRRCAAASKSADVSLAYPSALGPCISASMVKKSAPID